MKKGLTISITLLLLSGCNFVFMVPKDKVIFQTNGYLIMRYERTEFVPCKIDPNRSVRDNLINSNRKGYYIYDLPTSIKFNLLIYADTFGATAVVPVNLGYVPKGTKVKAFKKSEKILDKHILNTSPTIEYYVFRKAISFYSVWPLNSTDK